MKTSRRPSLTLLFGLTAVAVLASCSGRPENANTTATTTVSPPPRQVLSEVEPPQEIRNQMQARGEEEEAMPELHIVSPAEGEVINGSVVRVRLHLAGELKGYKPQKNPATGEGNHIHVILDNEPYEAYYDLTQPFELRNVTDGKHTLRVFPSRPWHQSYKNDTAFQMVTFTVRGGGDAAKPTTTNSGQTMANNNSAAGQGKDMQASKAGDVDRSKPLLTYSRPKGEYQGSEADPIMIDFWLSNAKLKGDGGEYRVRYIIDNDEPRFIDKWGPVWLAGWLPGKHTVRLELLGPDDRPVENGGYNVTTREITVVK